MAQSAHQCPDCKVVLFGRSPQEATALWSKHWRDMHVNKKKGRRQS